MGIFISELFPEQVVWDFDLLTNNIIAHLVKRVTVLVEPDFYQAFLYPTPILPVCSSGLILLGSTLRCLYGVVTIYDGRITCMDRVWPIGKHCQVLQTLLISSVCFCFFPCQCLNLPL